MSIYADVLQLTQAQANIQSTQAQTQLHEAQAEALGQNANVQRATRLAMQASAQAQAQAPAAAAGTAPTDPPVGIAGNPDVIAAGKDVTQLQSSVANAQQTSQAIRMNGGDPKLAEQYDTQAREAQANLAQAQLRVMQAKKDALQQASAVAASANPENFTQVKSQLDMLTPGWDKGQDVNFDPLQGGQTVYGDRTAKVLDAYSKQGQTAYQQAEIKYDTAKELRLNQDTTIAQERADTADKQLTSQDALRRARISAIADKQNAAAKPPPIAKSPQAHEINDLAPQLASDNNIPQAQARLMANDVLRRRNELQAQTPGMSSEDATAQATSEAAGRIQKGSTGTWYPGIFGGTKDVKPSYTPAGMGKTASGTGDTPDAQAAAVAALTPLTKAGIAAKVTGGAVTAPDGSPLKLASTSQVAGLPSGTHFIWTDGTERVKK
ncbi:MAG: hypothetical protein ACMG51_10220 [Ginsengibacter sp.]